MRKKITRIIVLIIIIVFAGGLYYIHLLTPVITGYAAKNLASGIFVGNRTQESLERTDLNFSFIKYTSNTVDYEKKSVTSRFLWATSTAIYIDGFGSTLVRDFDENAIRSRPYTVVPPPDTDPTNLAWPAGDKLADTVPAGIDTAKLNIAIASAFSDSAGQKGTFAVAVAYKNQLVAEKYRESFSGTNRFLSWSMAKSITHALVGIMVKKGMVKPDERADIAAWKDDGRNAITWTNLMQMSSGLEWNEDYGNLSDVTLMLHKSGDMAEFAAEKPLASLPGTTWLYSSGTTNIVCGLMRNMFENDAEYFAFPRRELFNLVGMRSAVFETDAAGIFVGSSYVYASMRDYVRFGLLYMNEGKWLGNQVLSVGWTNLARKPVEASGGKYGAFFWLNESGEYPDVPRDMYMCRGHDGQFIYIIPSLQLVVARTGFSKEGDFDYRGFLASVVAAVTTP